jgi:hypothetical protein
MAYYNELDWSKGLLSITPTGNNGQVFTSRQYTFTLCFTSSIIYDTHFSLLMAELAQFQSKESFTLLVHTTMETNINQETGKHMSSHQGFNR